MDATRRIKPQKPAPAAVEALNAWAADNLDAEILCGEVWGYKEMKATIDKQYDLLFVPKHQWI